MISFLPRHLFFPAIFILISMCPACSEDDTVTPTPTGSGVVEITVDESSVLVSGDTGYIFTSAVNGTLLDYATWTGPEELELSIPQTLDSGFLVTQVQDFHGIHLSLYTLYYQVTNENKLDLTKDSLGSLVQYATLRFQNIPPHDSYSLGSGSYSEHGGRLFETVTAGMRSEPVDILLTIGGPTTPRSFQWIADVTFDSEHQVDLAGIRPMEKFIIQLPPAVGRLHCSLSGYQYEAPGQPWLFFSLDSRLFDGSGIPAVWEADYLSEGFEGFLFNCQETVQESPLQLSALTTEGGLPGTISLWNMDMSVVDDSRDGCSVQVSESPDEFVAEWGPEGEGSISWKMVLPAGVQPIVLPHLPTELEVPFPDLDRELLFLQVVTAIREASGLAADGVTPMVTRDRVSQYQ